MKLPFEVVFGNRFIGVFGISNRGNRIFCNFYNLSYVREIYERIGYKRLPVTKLE